MFDYLNFSSDDDFRDNLKIDVPENFNFGFDCVDKIAEEEPDRLALIWDSDEGEPQSFTFGDVKRYSDAAARYFRKIGIGKGDRVMLILKRRVQFWFVFVGLIKIGAITIPATHLLTTDDIAYRNRAASVNAIVVADDERVMAAVDGARAESPSLQHYICVGAAGDDLPPRWDSLDDGMAAQMTGETLLRVTASDDIMLLYFTSGTTGYPKMVIHNHIYPLAHIITAKYWQGLHSSSIHFTLSDTGWAKAVWGKFFGQWLVKSAIFIYDHDKLVPSKLLKMLAKHRVTSFCAPPTVYRVLLTANFKNYDLTALECAASAGEPLSKSVYEDFFARTGVRIREAYGQTETVPIVLTTHYSEPRPGLLGRANPMYSISLLDADGTEIEGAGEGELCLRIMPGDLGIFMGYYRNPDMTDYAWRGGLYHTGDLVSRDGDGYYAFIGRADDIIKSAGYRIGPFEVESVVQQHPSVLECAVTGVPDPIRGQTIKASIILRQGFEASSELAKEIRAFVKANAASYKIPRLIEFTEELPKTISGKIRRVEIRK